MPSLGFGGEPVCRLKHQASAHDDRLYWIASELVAQQAFIVVP